MTNANPSRARSAATAMLLTLLLATSTGAGAQSNYGRVGQAQPKTALAEAEQAPTIILIDRSNSMADDDGTGQPKIQGARSAINAFIGNLPTPSKVGVRAYPSDNETCDQGSLVVDIAPVEPTAMEREVRSLLATGDGTSTAPALQAAARDLKSLNVSRGTILLVSDGESNCGGDPCEVARSITAEGLTISVNTIGFQISDEGRQELQCIASAGSGTYVDVTQASELAKELEARSKPRLRVSVDPPDTVSSLTGTLSNGDVDITATISVEGGQGEARNVVATIVPFYAAPPLLPQVEDFVRRPIRDLGNIGGEPVIVRWNFAITPEMTEAKTVDYLITASSDNASGTTTHWRTTLTPAFDPQTAGPLLRGIEHPVILGDSFSAGEGAGEYSSESNTEHNHCHRSPNTYATFLWAQEPVNLACSGAITADLDHSNHENTGEPPQIQQLAEVSPTPDLVLLTIGGNDIGFSKIILRCLNPGSSCRFDPVVVQANGQTQTITFGDLIFDRIRAMPAILAQKYALIAKTLNDPARVRARGSIAPIIVLPYPVITPIISRSCPGLDVGFSPDDFAFALDVQYLLNMAIDLAVRTARTQGLPVYFAADVADVMQPAHTICEGFLDQWVNNPLDVSIGLYARRIGCLTGTKVDLTDPKLAFGESFHPNCRGYRAMTAGLVRFSQKISDPQLQMPRTNVAIAGTETAQRERFTLDSALHGASELHPGQTIDLIVSSVPANSIVEVRIASSIQLIARQAVDAAGPTELEGVVPSGLAPGAHEVEVTVEGPTDLTVYRVNINVPGPSNGANTPIAIVGATALLIAAAMWCWPARSWVSVG